MGVGLIGSASLLCTILAESPPVPRSGTGIVLSRFPAQGRSGPPNRLLAPVHLIYRFRHTITTLRSTRPIMSRLRATKIQASPPLLRRLTSRPRTRVRTEMLSVEIGLL